MRPVLFLLSLLCVLPAFAQPKSVPFQFYVSRLGKVETRFADLYHRTPFNRPDQGRVDSIFQCEEMKIQYKDSVINRTQCGIYQWPFPDSVIVLNSWTELSVGIPFFNTTYPNYGYGYVPLNDSTWLGSDTIRRSNYNTRWHLNPNDTVTHIDVLWEGDSVLATYYYHWHEDGRIRSVVQVGIPLDHIYTDTVPVWTHEFVYNDHKQLRATCWHTGKPYVYINDSLIRWKQEVLQLYRDSLHNRYNTLLIPPGSTLTGIMVCSYNDTRLTDVFHCGQHYASTDTIIYDEQNRIERIRSYENGRKVAVAEFEYGSGKRLRRARTIQYEYGNKTEVYSLSFEYGAQGKISDIVLPPDKYNSSVIRHAYHLNYKLGN